MKILFFLSLLASLSACQPIRVVDQANLSRPAFDFSATGVRSMECSLSGQLETGRSSSSNVSAGGCSSCR